MTHKIVKEQQIIELKYTLREGHEKGPVLEIMDENWPLKFLFGSGAMLPGFENNLYALPEGAHFNFLLKASEAYGTPDPTKFIQVFTDDVEESHRYPLDNFEVGDYITITTQKKQVFNGTLSEINSHYLVIDTNHAMAGKDLHFSGQILFIKPASPEELSLNRYIEPNGFKSSYRFDDPI
ncbi:MAG: FKBP-type peptidyl-prolyl cis-trans isomerase [Luteibaculaceae bacterium]